MPVLHPGENSIDPAFAYAMDVAGTDAILEMDGVQPIATMAFGFFTGKPANILAGPGNAYVDFILYGKETFFAIEVKNAVHIHPKSLNGLKSFAEDYPEAKTCLLYRGKKWVKEKGILCIPCEDFLKKLVPGRPIPIS